MDYSESGKAATADDSRDCVAAEPAASDMTLDDDLERQTMDDNQSPRSVTKRERQKLRRQERLERERENATREARRRWLTTGVMVVVGTAAAGFLIVSGIRSVVPGAEPEGTTDVAAEDRTHTEEEVDYPTTPAAGGPHSPVWQNCGFYDEPVGEENAVHSLEHGAVWLTFDPDLADDQVSTLQDLAGGYVLVSPADEELPSPVVASAWGKQLTLDGADDPRIEAFIRAFEQGPQTPEPGAVCTRGIGEPV
ncbi:DUF3105 domain-containing protein [Euzebya tangerina]|uniref:DUF3105 domain-containing protein n=1 Tax=Euzebya tangerina TaxID=591198 RepID=UPI00196A4F27|nr:DUF3105 domain-containing protein [Euzebya tangerina]